jgi:signal transduction histidine kinase
MLNDGSQSLSLAEQFLLPSVGRIINIVRLVLGVIFMLTATIHATFADNPSAYIIASIVLLVVPGFSHVMVASIIYKRKIEMGLLFYCLHAVRVCVTQVLVIWLYLQGPFLGNQSMALAHMVATTIVFTQLGFPSAILAMNLTAHIAGTLTAMHIVGSDLLTMFSTLTSFVIFGMSLFALATALQEVSIHEKQETMVNALKESTELYRNLYTHAPIMFFTISSKTYRVKNLNTRSEKMSGISQVDLESMKPKPSFVDLFSEECRDEVRKILGQPDTVCDQYLLFNSTIGPRHVSMNISTQESRNKYDVILYDMTEFVNTAQKVQLLNESLTTEKEKAEQALAVRSQFIAKISHELRTPLHGVISCCDLLRDTVLTNDQLSCVSIIDKSGKLLLSLINTVLEFSRIDAGHFVVEEYQFSLQECLTTVVTGLKMTALSHRKQGDDGTQVVLRFDENQEPQVVFGAEKVLAQVLLNLIGNAVKFSNNKGTVTLEVQCKENGDDFMLHCSVSDEGIGIHPHDIARLFQSFSQLGESNGTSYGGTGLGLSICKRLVEIVGGTIGLERSIPNEGSTFYFTFPLRKTNLVQDKVQASPTNEPTHVDLTACKVMVVEDNIINQKVMLKMLNSLGITSIAIANDGQEAVDMFSENSHYDVLLIDQMMPKLNGTEATKVIRKLERGNSVAIIGCTANVMLSQREECILSGMDDVVTKPIAKTKLKQAIQDVLQKRGDS